MSGDAVLEEEQAAWRDLMDAAESVPSDRRQEGDVVPGWTAHDVLWHVAYWVGRAADVLDLARGGPPFPEEPEEGAYYDEQNAMALSAGREMTWAQIMDHFSRGRGRARAAMRGRSPQAAAWMEERFEEEIEHYRLHAAHLRAATG